MDFAAILYDPLYATFGIPAALTPNRPAATNVTVRVIEKTSAVDASEQFELGTIRPGVFIRVRDLTDAGIRIAELDGGLLTYNTRSWHIEAHAPRPGPDGEASGELLLFLSEENDG